MPLRAPVPETGMSTDSTSRVFCGSPSKRGSMGKRRREPADMQFSRLLRKPRKRNAAGFFRRGTQSESRTRKPVMGVGPSDRCVYHFTICAYWRSESGSRREASPCGKRSRALLPRLLSGKVSYLLEYLPGGILFCSARERDCRCTPAPPPSAHQARKHSFSQLP